MKIGVSVGVAGLCGAGDVMQGSFDDVITFSTQLGLRIYSAAFNGAF